MRKLLKTLAIVILSTRLFAQSNEPVRLALITETDEAVTASDVLTAQLSGNQKIQLLERNEIEKVYREQGLSAANKDYLKLGRILGADGLLLFDVVRTPQTTNLMTRLIAVKPGVVLTDGSFPWPLKDTTSWAESVATHLNSLLPKLALLPKDAIPISVVNLRSAVQSADGQEAERQLKLLAIQRLSQERQFFVLERQRMQLLSEEKELKVDDSAFWNGSFLLEGAVDQNGYSKETITVNARLTPPKGGAPMLMEVSGSRTNLSEVINHLAAKVTELLKVNSSVPEWKTTDEAAQYFDEARWALRWGSYAEAQTAAESAWALGRRDADSAMLRVRAYMVSPDAGKTVIFYPPKERPDAQNIVSALRALAIYNESGRNLPPDEPKVDSDWYRLGLENLTVASRVLQVFNWSPNYYKPVAEKLTELRAAARSTAAWISRSPSVHDSYFVGDRVAVYDELHHFEEQLSIFGLKLDCGCLWQDTPEDCIALYRELMSSPVFCYLHDRFWFRDTYHRTSLLMAPPRLIAWNETDQKRIPTVWNGFVQELKASTNVLWQLEAKALQLADATNEAAMAESFTNLFDSIFTNRSALISDNVEVLYLEWRTGDLVERMGGGLASATKDSLEHLYYAEYRPKLEAMGQEYRSKTVPTKKFLSVFEKQKQYLRENKPYDFFEFANLFQGENYSKAQALEIQPLIVGYKSNLVAQSQTASGMQKGKLMNAIAQVGFLENDVNRILNPPAPRLQPQSQPQPPKPASVAKTVVVPPTSNVAPEVVINVMTVRKFLPIPLVGLLGDEIETNSVTITAHHYYEGKLLVDFQYGAYVYSFDEKGNWKGTRNVTFPAIAILDPATEHWEVIACPEVDIQTQNNFYHRSTLSHGELFNCDGGQIKKYDFQKKHWQVLTVADGNNYELFAINGHLYAASKNMIVEILDGGKSTRILASTRRNPPASLLDGENLGTPTLFDGPNHSLRVSTSNKIFTWTGNDWREDPITLPALSQLQVFMDGILFHQAAGGIDQSVSLYFLATGTNAAELCLRQTTRSPNNTAFPGFYRPGVKADGSPEPLWKLPPDLRLATLPAAICQAGLYLLVDHSEAQDIVDEQQHLIVGKKILPKDGYNAALLCFSREMPLPQKMFLKFDAPDGCPPVTGINSGPAQMFLGRSPIWLFFSTNFLFCGLEKSDNFLPVGAGGAGCKPGVWMIPLEQIESATAAQKQIQLARLAQEKARAAAALEQHQQDLEQRRKDLLAKYDLSHNGIIDPEEKEGALDDPSFIESELDTIDVNHNGRLDAEELVWFDANQNKILDPKEQAGIDIAQHLLATKLLKQFDVNGDGFLDRSEFDGLWSPNGGTRATAISSSRFPDENYDGRVDLGELESFLKQQTRGWLHLRGGPTTALFNQIKGEANQPVGPRQLFKAAVEFYWQHPGGITNGPPFNRGIPPGQIGATNGMSNGRTP